MRIGYFGGTFDPPHRGHLLLARAAADAFALDRVLFAPTGRQPLKDKDPQAGYEDRLAMVRLLCNQDARFQVSTVDAPHPDGSPNYTVDVLRTLRETEADATMYALVGADSFLTLRRWRDADELLRETQWIVASRPGFQMDDLAALELTAEEESHVHLLPTVDDDSSSTEIRARLRFGVTPADRLTPEVLLYIARMHLYHAR